jgi:cell pole-organizing protein PopZ
MASDNTQDEPGLMSPSPAGTTTSAFAALAAAVDSSRGLAVGSGNRTLEDLVREMLRPMLRQWLDTNLPSLVGRIVEREVAKLAGRAEDDRWR